MFFISVFQHSFCIYVFKSNSIYHEFISSFCSEKITKWRLESSRFASSLLPNKRVSGEISCEHHMRLRWQMTLCDSWFARAGGCDDVSFRRFLFPALLPCTITVFLPFLVASGPTLFVRASPFTLDWLFRFCGIIARLCSSPPRALA